MTTPTITIARTDYTDRHDDEGQAFHASRTVETAAAAWGSPEHRWDVVGRDEEPVYVFAWLNDDGKPVLRYVAPDADMDDLYASDLLPFEIVMSPFAVGDTVYWLNQPEPRTVVGIHDNGDVDLQTSTTTVRVFESRLSMTPPTPAEQPAPAATGTETPAPSAVRTFVVTVPADLSEDDRGNFMRHLYSPGAERRGILVREAR